MLGQDTSIEEKIRSFREKLDFTRVEFLDRVCANCGTRYVRVEYFTEIFEEDEGEGLSIRETCPNLCAKEVGMWVAHDSVFLGHGTSFAKLREQREAEGKVFLSATGRPQSIEELKLFLAWADLNRQNIGIGFASISETCLKSMIDILLGMANQAELLDSINLLGPDIASQLIRLLDEMKPIKTIGAAEYGQNMYSSSISPGMSSEARASMADFCDNDVTASRGSTYEAPDTDKIAQIAKLKELLRAHLAQKGSRFVVRFVFYHYDEFDTTLAAIYDIVVWAKKPAQAHDLAKDIFDETIKAYSSPGPRNFESVTNENGVRYTMKRGRLSIDHCAVSDTYCYTSETFFIIGEDRIPNAVFPR